ncbi:CU044_2847 family protein [Streptomyces griseus]|uniref:CU044_2847 family protein n=1 Tax=Streptomyces griseus TaxID=1911 RepID=UPI00368498A6
MGVERMPLAGGGEILFEAAPELRSSAGEGPVKAGRVADAVRDLPRTVQDALVPVREMAQAAVAQLREAGPAEVEVEFGVTLSAQAGAVISKGEAVAHLKVRVLWRDGAGAGDTS